jgi:glycosidase
LDQFGQGDLPEPILAGTHAAETGAYAPPAPKGKAAAGGVGSIEPGASISLDRHGGDAWDWEIPISGACSGLDVGTSIDIMVNGDSHPADRADDAFRATVPLQPGDNTVQAIAVLDDATVASAPVIYTVRLMPRPTAQIRARVATEGVHLDGTMSEPAAVDAAPVVEYAWSVRRSHPGPMYSPVPDETSDLGEQPVVNRSAGTLTLPVRDEDGEYCVSLTVTDRNRRQDTATVLFAIVQGRARLVDATSERAAWTHGASVYGVIVRNMGLDGFRSVVDRLDDLAELGVAALWLAPVNVTVPGDFGYGIVDYFDVRPEYGTLEEFRSLVQEAHSRNIRVLMDIVPNHTSVEHPYSRDADRNGPASAYYTFYDRDESDLPTHYFGWTHLPNLDFDNPQVRRFITEALMFWVRELDVDGFRLDVAWGIKQRCPDFWPEFIAEFKRVKPDGLLIAEASARDPFYVNNGFDAAYDWTDELGIWAWTEAFAGEAPISSSMMEALTYGEGGHDPHPSVFRFLNNNDTGPRFITTQGVDCYRVASAMLLTLPGLPCVYTGDEVGAEFEPYVTDGPIDWNDRHGLRPHFRKLIHLRKELPGLQSRDWTALSCEPAGQVLSYVRSDADGDSPVLVLLNFSPEAAVATIEPAELTAVFGKSGTMTDHYNGTSVALGAGVRPTVPMSAWGIRILVAA